MQTTLTNIVHVTLVISLCGTFLKYHQQMQRINRPCAVPIASNFGAIPSWDLTIIKEKLKVKHQLSERLAA